MAWVVNWQWANTTANTLPWFTITNCITLTQHVSRSVTSEGPTDCLSILWADDISVKTLLILNNLLHLWPSIKLPVTKQWGGISVLSNHSEDEWDCIQSDHEPVLKGRYRWGGHRKTHTTQETWMFVVSGVFCNLLK